MSIRGVLKGFYLSCFYLVPAICLFCFNAASAGEIGPVLEQVLEEASQAEMVKVIAVFDDRVDNEKLDYELIMSKTSLARRHYVVVNRLQEKATLTQPSVLSRLENLKKNDQVANIRPFWISNMIAFEGTAEAIAQIADMPEIESVVYDRPVELIRPVRDENAEQPLIAAHSQGLDVMNVPAVWAMGYTGAGRLVANIDTGVEGTHPALTSRWRGNNGHPHDECWYDPVGSTNYPEDYDEHGTHTMGTICGRSSTTYDTVGVAINAQWIACASIDNGASTSDVIASFEFVTDPDDNPYTTDDVPDVVSNSWGWSPILHSIDPCDNTFWSVMDGCENAGVVVIFAAGNEGEYGSNSLRTPSDRATTYYNAFSVGAIDGHTPGYPITSFSSRGPCDCATDDRNIKPECVAPGYNIRSSVPGGGYESNGWNGTSMACPHIAGAVAILRQVNPNLTVNQIKEIIIQSCVDLGTSGEDNTYGHGYLNLVTAVQIASTGFGWVEGTVRESAYNTPIQATVSVDGTGYSTLANDQGYYILSLPPDSTYTIIASYEGYDSDQAQVYIPEDDTARHHFFLDPPIISYDPTSYNLSVPPGESTTRNLYISNTGSGSLNYSIQTEIFDYLTLDNGQSIPVTLKPKKAEPLAYQPVVSNKADQEPEPLYPPMVTGQGGPDNFGYTWIDSDEPGGPAVSWIDISGLGSAVTLSDDDTARVNIGFDFSFYDTDYTTLCICSNGMLKFGEGTTDYTNDDIPDSDTPNNFIAAFWDDLSPQNGGPVRYYYDSAHGRFIVSWLNVPLYTWLGGTGSLNFQIVLSPNGNIQYNYQTMDAGSLNLTSATVGIENANGNDGLPIAYNQSYLHSNMSVLIIASAWLSAGPGSGSVGQSETDTIEVTFDATELPEGTYTGNINLLNNSPNNPDIDIPVTLHVSELPTPLIRLGELAIYDTVYAGYQTSHELIIYNDGDTTLEYSLTDNRNWLDQQPQAGEVMQQDNDTVDIILDATSLSPGDYTGTITVNSNDPVNNSIDVPVHLFVDLLLTTDVGVTGIVNPPDSMATGAAYPIKIEVTNFGSEPQSFDIVFEAYYLNSGVSMFSSSTSVSNMPDSSDAEYTFAEAFTPDYDTTYTLLAYTTLTGDQIPGNDSYEKTARARDIISIWYGNLDLSPVPANPEQTTLIDIYIQTPVNAYVGDMHLCLGGDSTYISEMSSVAEGVFYEPLSEWGSLEFLGTYGTPPNEPGWMSESFMGYARLARALNDNPWFHSEVPVKIVSFAITVVDNENYIGNTYPAIGKGVNPYQGLTNIGDTLGLIPHVLTEQFSEILFTEGPHGCDFIPGDINNDDQTTGGDVTYGVNYFRGIVPPPADSCWYETGQNWIYAAGDVNGDCRFIGSDITYLVNYFRGMNTLSYCPETPPLMLPLSQDEIELELTKPAR